jgi:ketosteroid isomerase-like protein
MKKKTLIATLICGLLLAFAAVVKSGKLSANSSPEVKKATDVQRIAGLLDEMKTVDLSKLTPLPAERFTLPPAGVDVMRVRLEETYEIEGIGRDTVELVGWIAAKHDNARPADGETEVRWGTAIVDTEFVGLELRGESKLFGPVRVHLDPDHRSIGQVGKLDLPFVEQIALDAAYRDLRTLAPASSDEASNGDSEDAQRGRRGSKEDEAAVSEVMRGVWDAISNKDAAAVLRFYAPGSKTAKGGEEEVAKQFANVKTIKVTPNNDLRVRFMGRFANVTATGKNEVEDNEGKTGTSAWKANVQLEKRDGTWLITQDRTSLFPNKAGNMGGKAGKCLAKISVDVEMPNLDLKMKTKAPVTWYSEVETIPPVGYTASVSMTPTPMISAGRQVATLEHGAVKFRETVRRIPLEGTNWRQLAAKR